MKLSIITINYNNAPGLQKTMLSVLQQNFSDFEYIIIDGGSTDGSVELIYKYAGKLCYWVSEKDNGIYHAMNKGIAKAKGEYLLMLNSGDYLINANTITSVFSKQTDADVLYGDIEWKFKNNLQRYDIFPDKIDVCFFLSKSLAHQASFIKRTVHEIVGYYDEKLWICSDWKLFILAAKHNLTFQHINFVITCGDTEGLSWSAVNYFSVRKERMSVVKQYFPELLRNFKNLSKKSKPGFINSLRILKNVVFHKLNFKVLS